MPYGAGAARAGVGMSPGQGRASRAEPTRFAIPFATHLLDDHHDNRPGTSAAPGRSHHSDLHPDEDQTPYAYISDLIVLPRYRRRGIGRALLDRAEALVRSSGAKVLRGGVLAKNEPAARLYRSAGFAGYQLQLVKKLP
jgi:ribosomal protein S18 acetylase RimI-like enzyme